MGAAGRRRRATLAALSTPRSADGPQLALANGYMFATCPVTLVEIVHEPAYRMGNGMGASRFRSDRLARQRTSSPRRAADCCANVQLRVRRPFFARRRWPPHGGGVGGPTTSSTLLPRYCIDLRK